MQQSVVKFIALLYRHCSACFGHYNAHHQEPYECGGGSVLSRGRFVNKPTTAENTSTSTFIQKPEAATAVWRAPDDGHCNARNMLNSVCTTKQKILRFIVASSWVFYLSDWRCTEPQTLNKLHVSVGQTFLLHLKLHVFKPKKYNT